MSNPKSNLLRFQKRALKPFKINIKSDRSPTNLCGYCLNENSEDGSGEGSDSYHQCKRITKNNESSIHLDWE